MPTGMISSGAEFVPEGGMAVSCSPGFTAPGGSCPGATAAAGGLPGAGAVVAGFGLFEPGCAAGRSGRLKFGTGTDGGAIRCGAPRPGAGTAELGLAVGWAGALLLLPVPSAWTAGAESCAKSPAQVRRKAIRMVFTVISL